MTFADIEKVAESLVGSKVEKPKGTLAGHAAGLPFERLVHEKITSQFPGKAYRQFEFLNRVFLGHPQTSSTELQQLLGPPSLRVLLSRGAGATKDWSPQNQFVEKQNDTAETIIQPKELYTPGDRLSFLDVKTHNVKQNGQPPNIMSAEKLARALHAALEEGEILFDFIYLGIDWVIDGGYLVAESSRVISMFKINRMPYINWTAAQQLQFHMNKVDQDFEGSSQEWARQYLGHVWKSLVTSQDEKRARFREFEKYAEN